MFTDHRSRQAVVVVLSANRAERPLEGYFQDLVVVGGGYGSSDIQFALLLGH